MATKPAAKPRPTPVGTKKPVKPTPAAQKPTQKKPVPAPVRAQSQSAAKKPVSATATKKPAAAPAKKPVSKSVSTPAKKPTVQPSRTKNAGLSTTKPVTSVGGTANTNTASGANANGGSNWINRTVQNRIAGVGNYAGGWVNSVGESVNKIGEGIGGRITDMSRSWGQGVSGYGNNIKDSVGVGGPRASTAKNPLGLAGQGSK